MKMPLQTTYRDVHPSARLEHLIREQVDKLESHRPDVIGCRVAVAGPSGHHRSGGHYDVRIDVTVPGGEIVITRDQPAMARHERCDAAVRDAFKLARRVLDERHGRRGRGQRGRSRTALAQA